MTADNSTSFPFDEVIITFPDQRAADAASSGPLKLLKYNTSIVATTDPYGARVGSGGGTLSALACSTGSTILILHAGGESSRCPTQMVLGKAWTSLPCSKQKLVTPVELWLELCRQFFRNIPTGSVVVVATDILLQLSSCNVDWNTTSDSAVLGLAVLAPLETARNHGVFVLSDQVQHRTAIVSCQSVWQKPTISELHEHCQANDEPMAWIDSGVVIFMPKAATVLRTLAIDPLGACTRQGLKERYEKTSCLDESIQQFAKKKALQVDIYTHILQSLALADQDSTASRRQTYCARYHDQLPAEAIFDALSLLSLKVLVVPDGHFLHLGTTRDLYEFLLHGNSTNFDGALGGRQALCQRFGHSAGLTRRLESLTLLSGNCDDEAVVYHSILASQNPASFVGKLTVVEHCMLEKHDQPLCIGNGCLISGMRGNREGGFVVPDGLCVQMVPLQCGSYVYMVLGMDDKIKTNDSVYGRSLRNFFVSTGLSETDLWERGEKQILWTARLHPLDKAGSSFAALFPWLSSFCQGGPLQTEMLKAWKESKRLSLSDIRDQADATVEFLFREQLPIKYIPDRIKQHLQEIHHILMNRQNKPIDLHFAIVDFTANESMHYLCQVLAALDTSFDKSLEQKMYDVAGRACMIMSGVFHELSELISVPNAEKMIQTISSCISKFLSVSETGTISSSISKRLSISETGTRMQSKDHKIPSNNNFKPTLTSMAMLMEKVAKIMTMKCVSPSSLETPSDSSYSLVGKWVIAAAPARVDLAGAWSDTPPVCCEFGGAVTGMAVTIDGLKPLSCRCRIVCGSGGIELRSESRNSCTGELESQTKVVLGSLSDLVDYGDPRSECALLKCALVCLGFATIEEIGKATSDVESFQKAINAFCNSETDVKLEVVSASLLPRGSGLGTSSILGGCILAAIGKCVGKDFLQNVDSKTLYPSELISAVSVLEQLLTTGGGWQDQANGLVGGVKTIRCDPYVFPIELSVEKIDVSISFKKDLNSRLLLAFTGKTRLAKNILQNVLSRWSKRAPEIVGTVEKLVACAERAQQSIAASDINSLAANFNENWELKKTMAGNDSGVEPPLVTAITSEFKRRNLITSASLCGAGGGGFIAMFVAPGVSRGDLEESLENSGLELIGFKWYDSKLCEEGVTVKELPSASIDRFDLEWLSEAHPIRPAERRCGAEGVPSDSERRGLEQSQHSSLIKSMVKPLREISGATCSTSATSEESISTTTSVLTTDEEYIDDPANLVAYLEEGKRVIRAENEALSELIDSLDNDFGHAVALMRRAIGRVVVTGVGKSGIIAQKIAATFSSTGTPSVFVHAGDASHGDLGMISNDDVVLAISKSGESAELAAIMNYCGHIGIPLIAITQEMNSTLGRAALYLLLLPEVPEACNMKVAPTTSSTATLALGDALAVALSSSRGFSLRDFGLYHPGGQLGKLTMRIEAVMSAPPVCDQETTTVAEALMVMAMQRQGCVGLVDTQQQLVGVITGADLQRHSCEDMGCLVRHIMSPCPPTADPRESVQEVLQRMNQYEHSVMFVVHPTTHVPVGVVHAEDLRG